MSSFIANKDFDANRTKTKKPFHGVYNEVVLKTYVEYGLQKRWNVVMSLPYKSSHYVDDYSNIHNAGFQDFSLLVKWGWKEQPVVVSYGIGGSVPTGYNRLEPLALGNERSNIQGRFFISRGIRNKIFLNLELAKDRVGVPYLLETTTLPVPWMFAKVYISGFEDLPAQRLGEEYASWNVLVGLTSQGSDAIVRVPGKKSLTLAVGYGETFRGRNTGAGAIPFVSMAFVF
jgi:hypothetical protein